MTAASVIAALCLPPDARVHQRVPKKLLVENGAPTAADKRQINDGIEELLWLAALKPATIGVPVFRDDTREYLEIAVLSLILRAGAKATRLMELVHRAIPYPVLLVQDGPAGIVLSLSHLRWSQGQAGQTVLDGPLVTVSFDRETHTSKDFLASLDVNLQPRAHLRAFYQGWMERFEAYAAARVTASFTLCESPAQYQARRDSLAARESLMREVAALRSRAEKERQLSRRVELNLEIKRLDSAIAQASENL